MRRRGAERYLQLNLLSFAASVTFTRFFLELTGYPQLGNNTLHIAHVLYGGILLYIGSLIPLVYANRWAYTWSSVISGVGVGLFIDEVGKFITQNNDYFFPAAAPIIYAFFLTSVLIYSRVTKETLLDTRTELYAVLESLEEAIDHDMDPEEHDELRERLKRLNEKAQNTDLGMLADQILEFVDSEAIHISPDEPNLYDRAIDRFTDFEERWLSQSRLRVFLIGGVLLMGLAASIRLIYYLGVWGQADIVYSNIPAARKIHLSKWYYIFLYGTLIPACAAFFITKKPLVLLTMGTWLAAFAMAFYCPLLAYVNNRLLPKELRPKWYQTLWLVIGTVFYWGMILYSLSIGALPK